MRPNSTTLTGYFAATCRAPLDHERPQPAELGHVALALQGAAADNAGLDSVAIWNRIAPELRAMPRPTRLIAFR